MIFFPKKQALGHGTIISNRKNVIIGENSTIGNYCLLSGKDKIVIGDNVTICDMVQIISFGHNFKLRDSLVREQGITASPIIIESDCFIGAGSIILAGSVLKKGSILPPRTVYRG